MEGFQTQVQDGIYIFESPGCFTCSHQVEEFSKHCSSFYVVPTSEDPAYFDSIGIEITPTTRIYKCGKIIWEMSGVLWDTQLEEMRNFL